MPGRIKPGWCKFGGSYLNAYLCSMSEATIQTGAVHSYENCPHCKSDKSLILETHVTGEQVGSCGACGYSFLRKVLHNDAKEPILDSENKFIYTTTESNTPYGAIHIIDNEGDANMYCVSTEEDFTEKIIPFIEENKANIQEAVLSQFINNQFVKTNLLKWKDSKC